MTQRLGPQAARVYSHIRQAIDSGELPSGTKLPPQAHLGRQHGVALLTVRQALARLQAEGLVVSIHGKGTYVAASGPTAMPWTGRSASAGPEEYYREIVETSPSGIAFTDATGRVIMINGVGAQMFGYEDPSDMVGLDIIELAMPEDRPRVFRAVEQRLTLQVPAGRATEYWLRRRDGTTFPAEVNSSVTLDETGQPKGLTIFVQDITERKRAEEALAQAQERYRSIFDRAAIAINVADAQGRLVDTNPAFARMLGYEMGTLIGMRFQDLTHPDDLDADLALHRELLDGRRDVYQHEKRYVRKDGEPVWVRLTVFLLHSEHGRGAGTESQLGHTIALIENISERKQAEYDRENALSAAREREAQFRALFEQSPDGIVLLDPHDRDCPYRIVDCNLAEASMHGYTREELIGQPIEVLTREPDGGDEDEYLEEVRRNGMVVGDDFHFRKDGTAFPMEYSTSIVMVDGRELVLGIDRDITERRNFEETLRHQAHHDPLTGLPNRTLLHDRLGHALESAHRHDRSLALLLMDLDHFKEINDTFGHHSGDLLLKEVARRLCAALREADTVARLGGDEFAILLEETDSLAAEAVARKVLAAVAQPYTLDGFRVDVKTSIGIALYPEHGGDRETLLRRADVAMYVAKRSQWGYARYDAALDQYNPERLALVAELREAIARDELILHYQPKVDLRAETINGVEALVRWVHPRRGLVPPDQFITAAEESGLITPLTIWVVERALKQARIWHEVGLDLPVAVNLSARNLHDPDLVSVMSQLLDEAGADASWLRLEITESAIMTDTDRALETLSGLRDLGITVSIDDFGTGYSSLAYLQRLPVDEIKIDRSFISNLASNEENNFIVHAIVDLGHNLGLRIVAEGVEDQQTLSVLRAMGSDLVQGYFFSRPLPPESLVQWLERDEMRSFRILPIRTA
ncbi:MAG TPA: EAL domain-containing protein [Chloroflexota bacterium]|nr:EAL domain-containing protein [Chloroflexota bacterium]